MCNIIAININGIKIILESNELRAVKPITSPKKLATGQFGYASIEV